MSDLVESVSRAIDPVAWRDNWSPHRAKEQHARRQAANDKARDAVGMAADRIAELEARVKVLEKCLCNVKYEADRQNGNLVHLKKTIAVQVVSALNPSARSE